MAINGRSKRIAHQSGFHRGDRRDCVSARSGPRAWLLALLALCMAIGVAAPGNGPIQLLYRKVLVPVGIVKPNREPGNPAPHRFAQAMGAVCLALAAVLLLLGFDLAGWLLGFVVLALALVNLRFRLLHWMLHLPASRAATGERWRVIERLVVLVIVIAGVSCWAHGAELGATQVSPRSSSRSASLPIIPGKRAFSRSTVPRAMRAIARNRYLPNCRPSGPGSSRSICATHPSTTTMPASSVWWWCRPRW